MSSVSSSRAGSEQPLRASRPSTSRAHSSSKLSQRTKKVAQQEQACCSDGGEVVLICCDSPDCVAEDIPLCASDAGDIPDDCVECQQAAETGCSGNCIAEAVKATAGDCPECVGEHASDKTTNKDRTKHPQILSPSQAFNAEEPIQACDVPGCSALEWDEKAVDELLRCCCSGADHHHQSFAIPSYNSASKHAHANVPEHSHQHTSSTSTKATSNAAFSGNLPAPSQNGTRAFHAHHHYHGHGSEHTFEPSATTGQAFPTASTTYDQNPHIDATTSAHVSSEHYRPPGHVSYTSKPALPQQLHTGNAFFSDLSSSHVSHSRSQSLPSVVASQPVLHQVPSMNTTPPLAAPTFHCEWSDCSEYFPSREELIGHVTVSHLLQAKASSTRPTCAPPTPAHSQISSVARLSETRDGSQSLALVSQSLPPVSSNMFPSMGQYPDNAAAVDANNIFGNLQNQAMDPSFDHTLRCLWDSCEASVPLLGSANGIQPTMDNSIQTANPHYHSHTNGTLGSSDMSNAQGSFQALSDQSTASLVRHLLQDHLHLPGDVLGQLSPGIALNQSNGQAGPCTRDAGQMPQNVSAYIDSAPVSAYSTPHSGPRPSAWPSPLGNNSPRPPATIAGEHHEFDVGLSASWPSHQTITQESLHVLPLPAAQDECASHNCRWKGCRLTFGTTAELMEHISSEHIGSGKSMYYCEWDKCDRAHEGRGFNQRQKVMRHVRTHVGDKPFVCTVCGRAFSESTTMAQHMRTHTNEKPFECPEPGCGKTFALQSALTIHMRVHTGEKPFKCPHPGCDMAFAESSNLSKHVKTHLPKAPISSSGTPSMADRTRKRRFTSTSDLEDPPYLASSAKMLKA